MQFDFEDCEMQKSCFLLLYDVINEVNLHICVFFCIETQQKPANNRINAPLTRSKGKDDCYKWCDEGGKGGSWGGGGGSWGGDDNGGHKGGHHKGGHKGSSSSSSSSESSDSSADDDRKAHAQNRQAPVAPLHAKQRVANVTGHHQVAPAARKRINARAKSQIVVLIFF